ncbi:hypothetical protein BGZ76_011299 [Entomortierella beljakovae]|nr:hypothetical protein BGZ76_011299 [Entomortierella beljakovae]
MHSEDRRYKFLCVFRGKHVEEEREVSSDEDELDIKPRQLWPDDGTTDHVSRDERYDISPFKGPDPTTRLLFKKQEMTDSPHRNEIIPNSINIKGKGREIDLTDTLDDESIDNHDQEFSDSHNVTMRSEPEPEHEQETVNNELQLPVDLTDSDSCVNVSITVIDDEDEGEGECYSFNRILEETPRRPTVILVPDSLQLDVNQETVASESEQIQSPRTYQENDNSPRSRSCTPDYDSQQGEYSRPSTPTHEAGHFETANTNIDRGYMSETVTRVMGDELEENCHSPHSPSNLSTPSSPLIARSLPNPFVDTPDTRDPRIILEERETRRLESRFKLAYVLRGHKYGVSPSLYEYDTPSEIYGPRALWPRRLRSPSRGTSQQIPHGFRDGLPVSPSIYDSGTPTIDGPKLTWEDTKYSLTLFHGHGSNPPPSPSRYENEQDEQSEHEHEHEHEHEQEQQQQQQQQKPFYLPYQPVHRNKNGGGGGSSIYGSFDDGSQATQCTFEEFSAPAKICPIDFTPAEKHGLDEDDGEEECTESEIEGHICESFDRCWGTRKHIVGVYLWDEEANLSVEIRADKLRVVSDDLDDIMPEVESY